MKTESRIRHALRARQLLAQGMLGPAAAVQLLGQRGGGEEADLKLRHSRRAQARRRVLTYWRRTLLPRLAGNRTNGLLRAQRIWQQAASRGTGCIKRGSTKPDSSWFAQRRGQAPAQPSQMPQS
jgi:hypothetical protein